MSYKYDVGLLIKVENWVELNQRVKEYGFEDYELCTFKNHTYSKYLDRNFIAIVWEYKTWDVATNECLDFVEEYLKMLKLNNIPFRFIKIGEMWDDLQEERVYGKNTEDIYMIEQGIFPCREIKILGLDNGEEY